jgi:hypothetical protein
MNKQDIELALQAGLGKPYVSKTRCTSGVKINDVDALQRFADIIRIDEREKVIKYIQDYPRWLGDNAIREIIEAIRARGNT